MTRMRWLGLIVALVLGVTIFYFLSNGDRATSKDALLVGCITPLTGEGAAYGVATQRGLDLALARINSEGGIKGQPVKVICEDDQMNARTATSAIEKLVTVDKTPVIIGAFGSSITLAIAPIAERRKVVLFSASSTADEIRDSGDYVFRNVPPNKDQGKSAATFALRKLNAKTAAILRMNNDYGLSLSQSFQQNFETGGGKILSVDSYNPSATDFRAQLVKLREEAPDIVFFPGHYQESALILKQAREMGVKATFLGGDGSYAPELIQIGGPASEGSYYTLMAIGSEGDNDPQSFANTFTAKYNEEPDVYSAYAYDALLMVAEAIRKGGYNADAIKKQLYELRNFRGVTGLTQFDANGEVDKPYGIYKVQDGRFQLVSSGN